MQPHQGLPPGPSIARRLERDSVPVPMPGPRCLPVAQVPLHPLLAGAVPRVGVAGAHAARGVTGAGSGWGEMKAAGEPRSRPAAPAQGRAPPHLQPPSLRLWYPSLQRSHFQPVTLALQRQVPELSHWGCREPVGTPASPEAQPQQGRDTGRGRWGNPEQGRTHQNHPSQQTPAGAAVLQPEPGWEQPHAPAGWQWQGWQAPCGSQR